MAGFLEQRISVGIQRGTSGGPTGFRDKVYSGDGRLVLQNFRRIAPVHRYVFAFGKKLLSSAEEVRSFFYVVMFTPYSGFRARDWNDYQLTQDNSTLTLISGSDYQLQRVYQAGSAQFLRKIVKTEAGTETVYRTRGGITTAIATTVDSTTGIVTISGHVGGDTYTCECNFDVPVTFSDDDAMSRISLGGSLETVLQDMGDIHLEEVAL
jgi:uncharacterized protein (TIGR02217 family)